MKYQLHCNKETLNTLNTKYTITKCLVHNYINLTSNKDITDIEKLLNKTIVVSSKEKLFTVID